MHQRTKPLFNVTLSHQKELMAKNPSELVTTQAEGGGKDWSLLWQKWYCHLLLESGLLKLVAGSIPAKRTNNMKTKPQEVKRSERCDCDTPTLIDKISVGVNGYFTFCTKCNREKRISQQELDKMIKDSK